MSSPWTPELLSPRARNLLKREAKSSNVIDDGFASALTTFNQAGQADSVGAGDDVAASMRAEISAALDKLDAVVVKVLSERKSAEASATKWITIGGVVVVLLVILAAAAPLFTDAGILPSVFSSLSVGGLLILLYSPVRERLAIANDRSNLLLMTQGFRLRFATANTVEQLQALGQELANSLKFTGPDN